MTQNKACAVLTAAVLTAGIAMLSAQGTQSTQGTQGTQPQKPSPGGAHAEITKTFTIQAIDYQTRVVTLKDADGNVESVVAGPQVQRFNDLKAGDKVTFTYMEALVYEIRPAGSAEPTMTSQSNVVRDTGAKPGGTISKQQRATVTVTALDPAVPSVAVKTDDGRTMSFKIADKKKIEHVKVGDRVDIVYTQALAVKVK